MIKMYLLCVRLLLIPVVCALILIIPGVSLAELNIDDSLLKGASVMFGADTDVDVKRCPQGARVVDDFLRAWRAGEYAKMYALIDDDSKTDYSFDQAKFDFQFMEYKPYKISSLRAVGKNFEFILKCGAYKDNDIRMIKLMINGMTFKIMRTSKNSVFKRSVEDYMN